MNNSIQVAIQPQTGAIMAQVPANNAAAFGLGALLGIGLTLYLISQSK